MKRFSSLIYYLFPAIIIFSTFSYSQQITWVHASGPVAEFIKCFSINQQGMIFCGTATHGIYKSNNSGSSWSNSIEGLPASDVNTILSAQNGIVYAGLNGGGIAKSTDSGETWQAAGILLNSITSLAENLAGNIFASGWGTIYRSANSGLDWDTLTNGLPGADWIESLVINSAQKIFAVSNINGVFFSEDNGDTFASAGLTGIELNFIVRNSLDYIFVSSNGNGVYRSTDDGASWEQVNTGLTNLDVNTLWCDNNDNILAGLKNGNVFFSNNDGFFWQLITTSNSLSEVNSIITDEFENIFVGTNLNGVFCSSEGNYKWAQCNDGFRYSEVLNLLAVDSTQVLAATYINGIFRTSNKGSDWFNNALQGNIGLTLSFSSNKKIYAGLFAEIGFFGDKIRSDDNGYTWISIGTGLPFEPAYDFAFTKYDEVFAAIAGGGAEIYYSSDSGSNWNKVSNTISNPIFSLAINLAGMIFAGSNFGIIYRSNNSGLSWTELNVNSPNTTITKIAIDRKSFLFAVSNSGGGIFRSTDNGSNWQSVSNNLPDTIIHSILIDPNDLIFIATDSQGVYFSKDNGDSWTPTSPFIPLPNVTSLALDDEGFLYAGTRYNGVYRTFQSLTDVEIDPVTSPVEFSLSQNYPNPFNPSTKISWQSPVSSHQTIKIYDVLGNEVATLIDEFKQAGSYEVDFDASQLSSGIYFYKLQVFPSSGAGGFFETRKMVLMK